MVSVPFASFISNRTNGLRRAVLVAAWLVAIATWLRLIPLVRRDGEEEKVKKGKIGRGSRGSRWGEEGEGKLRRER